ncbi:MAG: hypothetical protein PHV82_16600 [Victivallaceae bacterium]|nr:hypothetical protein [Victivallaceae bacterium]
MKKKLLLIVFTAASLFLAASGVDAADETVVQPARKAGGFDRTRPNNFTETMKKLGRYLLLYIPNRVVDATDIITMDFSMGGAFAAEVQATRYFQLGGSYGETYFLAKDYARQYGTGHKATKRFGFFFMEKDVTFVDATSGTVNEYVIDFPQFSTADYHLDAFRDNDVDFWKIGCRVGWFLGIGVGIHPVEIADFITGIFWLDFLGDDF